MTAALRARHFAIAFVAGNAIAGCGEPRGDEAAPAADSPHGLVGTLEAQVASYDDRTETFYRLVRADGTEIPLDFGETVPPPVGERIVVRGPRVGNGVVVDGFDIAGLNRDHNEWRRRVPSSVERKFRIAAIILDAKVPPATFRSRIFGAFDSVATFFGENSYGAWTFEGDVFGPYSVSFGNCTDMASVAAAAKEAAAAADGLDPTLYDKFFFRVPPDASCTWNSLSDFGRNEVRGLISGTHTWYTLTDCATLTNAAGVSFGLRRSHQCTAPPYVTGGYGATACDGAFQNDPFSPMGSSCGHFSAPESGALGFIHGCNTLDVTSSGTFEIGPIEAKCAGAQIIRVSANANSNFGPQYVYLEYRLGGQAVRSDLVSTRGIYFHASAEYGGNETKIPDASLARQWALDSIYIHDPIDTLGTAWTEPSSGATFKLLAMGPTATVEVTIPGSTPGPVQCLDGALPPASPMCAKTLARFRDGGALGDGASGDSGSSDAGQSDRIEGDAGDCSCTIPGRKAPARAPVVYIGLAALFAVHRRRRAPPALIPHAARGRRAGTCALPPSPCPRARAAAARS